MFYIKMKCMQKKEKHRSNFILIRKNQFLKKNYWYSIMGPAFLLHEIVFNLITIPFFCLNSIHLLFAFLN